MKTALITGGNGFVGRALRRELVERGYRLTWIDYPLDMVTELAGYRQQYDLVAHAAYVVGGRAGINNNRMALSHNLRLDAELFRWAVATEQPHVLYFSSSAAYPVALQSADRPNLRLVESNGMGGDRGLPDADYGWAKLTGERLAANARAQGVTVSIVRPFSGYGATQPLGYPFPDFIARAKRREDPFVVWGNAGQRRDWIHITDVVKGALAVVEADAMATAQAIPEYGWRGPVNLCSGIGMSMFELARQVCEAAGYYPTITTDPKAPMGVMNRVGDPTKMRDYYRDELLPLSVGIANALAGVGL